MPRAAMDGKVPLTIRPESWDLNALACRNSRIHTRGSHRTCFRNERAQQRMGGRGPSKPRLWNYNARLIPMQAVAGLNENPSPTAHPWPTLGHLFPSLGAIDQTRRDLATGNYYPGQDVAIKSNTDLEGPHYFQDPYIAISKPEGNVLRPPLHNQQQRGQQCQQ